MLGGKSINYVAAAVAGRALHSGIETELNAALEIQDTNGVELPLAILGDDVQTRQETPGELRTRADAVTDLNATDHGVRPAGFLDRVFGDSVAVWLGVTFQNVDTGVSSHIAVTGGASAATTAAGSAKDAEAFTLSATKLEPHRLVSRYVYRSEDASRLVGLEEAMRRDLASSLSDALDKEVVNGSAGTHINGLLDLPASQQVDVQWGASLAFDTTAITNTLASLSGLMDGAVCCRASRCKNGVCRFRVRQSRIGLRSSERYVAQFNSVIEKLQPEAAASDGTHGL